MILVDRLLSLVSWLLTFKHSKECLGNRRFECHVVAEDGVIEVEAEGVESEAADGVVAVAVFDVAADGVAEVLHVYTDLVLATGFEFEFYQRVAVVRAEYAVVGEG